MVTDGMDDPTREIVALWTAVYGEPPAITLDPGTMLRFLVEGLPELPLPQVE